MKEIKVAIGPSRVLMFPIQLNWWDVRDDNGGGQDYTALAAATDALYLMAYDETWLWKPQYVKTSAFTGVEIRPFTHSGKDTLRDFIHLATDKSTNFPMPIPPEKLLVGLVSTITLVPSFWLVLTERYCAQPWYGYDLPVSALAPE
jgi:hypothetical protein